MKKMLLVLDVNDKQKSDILHLANQLHVPVKVLEMTEEEEDRALYMAMQDDRTDEVLSPAESRELIKSLLK